MPLPEIVTILMLDPFPRCCILTPGEIRAGSKGLAATCIDLPSRERV